MNNSSGMTAGEVNRLSRTSYEKHVIQKAVSLLGGNSATENRNTVIELSETSLKRLADLIGEKIIATTNAPEPWITIDALSAAIGVPKKTIYKHNREIPHLHGRPCRYRKSEVEAWFKKR